MKTFLGHAKPCTQGTEIEREKGKSFSAFSISSILSKEEQQQQQQRLAAREQSDIEESEDEEGGDDDSEPPDPEQEDVKDRLKLEPSLVHHLPGGHLGPPLGVLPGSLDPASLASISASLADPLRSYLTAAAGAYSVAGAEGAGLVPGLGQGGVSVSEAGRNVIKVPAHRPAPSPSLPLPMDYSAAAPWLYRPAALSGLPSYLPLPSSLLLNRFGGEWSTELSVFSEC